MYDLTVNIETEQTIATFVPTGINENLRLGKVDGSAPITLEKSKNNNWFIAFNFLNPEGLVLVHTEYEPSDDDKDKLAKKQKNLVKRILHIGKKLVDESLFKPIGKTESFEQLAKSYINIIGDNWKGKLFRVKVIYNNKNFTTLPNYVPFIESMSIPKEQSKLKMSDDDKVIKSKADVISSRPNPFTVDSPVPSVGTVNDLPF